MKDKIIIHNYTDLSDWNVLDFISQVVSRGKISTCSYGDTYCFATTFPFSDNIVVTCDRVKDTYTFKIFKE